MKQNEIHQSLSHKIDKADWNGILLLKIVCCTILHAYLSGFNVIDCAYTPTNAKSSYNRCQFDQHKKLFLYRQNMVLCNKLVQNTDKK
jgi:hypothetical protein